MHRLHVASAAKGREQVQAAAGHKQQHRNITPELPDEIRDLFSMKLGARGYALLGVPILFLCLFTHLLSGGFVCVCVLQPEVCSSK